MIKRRTQCNTVAAQPVKEGEGNNLSQQLAAADTHVPLQHLRVVPAFTAKHTRAKEGG